MKTHINFRGVGQPTERMVECMKWITSIFPLRQDLEEYDEQIWWDYNLASKFIGANIDRTKEEQYKRRQVTKERHFYSHPRHVVVIDQETDAEMCDFFGFNPYDYGDQE